VASARRACRRNCRLSLRVDYEAHTRRFSHPGSSRGRAAGNARRSWHHSIRACTPHQGRPFQDQRNLSPSTWNLAGDGAGAGTGVFRLPVALAQPAGELGVEPGRSTGGGQDPATSDTRLNSSAGDTLAAGGGTRCGRIAERKALAIRATIAVMALLGSWRMDRRRQARLG